MLSARIMRGREVGLVYSSLMDTGDYLRFMGYFFQSRQDLGRYNEAPQFVYPAASEEPTAERAAEIAFR